MNQSTDPFTALFGYVGDYFSGIGGGAPAPAEEWDPWDHDRGLQIKSPNTTLPAPVSAPSIRQYLRQSVGPRLSLPDTRATATTDAAITSGEKLSWVAAAEEMIGTKEVYGADHDQKIVDLWASGKAGEVYDDETPWCAAFVSDRLEHAGVQSARTGWARNYLKWGTPTSGPAVGSVVVFERGPKFGHVGFVVGKDHEGNLMVLGGNQKDSVSVAPFPTNRVLGYRWPEGQTPPAQTGMASLPLIRGGRLSNNEQ